MYKIINFNKIEKIVNNLRHKNKKIVLCHGVFDLVHIGHLDYFREAKKYGEILIVSVTHDDFVNKAPGRPFFNINQRLNFLSSIDLIDYLVESKSETSENIIKIIKPNIYFKGADYKNNNQDVTGNIKKEINIVKKYNGKILYSDSLLHSSSKLLNEITTKDLVKKKFLENIKSKYSFEKICKIIDNVSKINVLVIGEVIFDKYIFCNNLGRSGKENIQTLEKIKEKTYLGGSLSLAKNISSLAKKITICSVISRKSSDINFIKKNIKKNMRLDLIRFKSYLTILKEKIIDFSNNIKILGIYNFKDELLDEAVSKKISKKIIPNLHKNDVVLISDYGHGLISKKLASYLIKKRKKNIFVNTQLNAANFGYHTISKYKNSSCAIINEVELRHEMRNRYSEIPKLLPLLSKKLNIKKLIVTAGSKGSFGYCLKTNEINYCPAFTSYFKDKIGAGDCYMAIFSIICNIYPADMKLAMFVASVATIDIISNYGNEFSVDKTRLKKRILYMLK